MSAVNEVFITFDELLQLKNEDISACVDVYSAINICEKSAAPANKVYNLWVQKLFKAYNLEEVSSKDWQRIMEHLGNVLGQFVKNLNDSTFTSYIEPEQWWLDSQEFLKWMKTINHLDFLTLCSIMNFALEILLRTCKFANNRNFKILCELVQLVLDLTKSFLYKMPINDCSELEIFNKIISSLCDVGTTITSPDVKVYIEIWRTVAKLGAKLHNSFRNISVTITQTQNSINTDMHWHKKAIFGIFKELKKILQFYNENPSSNNDNILQVAQFYLKLLSLIINYSKETIKEFPAINEFMEICIFRQHNMANKGNPKMELFINKPLFNIFLLIYRENIMAEVLLQHLKDDADNFKSCKLVFDYLEANINSCSADRLNIKLDVEQLLKVYSFLVEGPLIFIDGDKYTKILEYFVVLTIMDITNQMHKKLCEFVVDLPWIRAYTSMEVLTIYYSYMLNQRKSDINLKCLEFWLMMWNRLNKSNKTYRQNKKLIEVLLKTILNNTSNDNLQQYTNNQFENIEIILLMCDKHTEQSLQYLHINLIKNLKKIQERCLNGELYIELLNLLEICILKPQFINDFLKENILITLTGLLTLSALEMQRFHEFINKCLRFFSLQQNQQHCEKLLKYLMDHEQQCCNIVPSVFLVEFLLKQRPQSTKLLKELNIFNKLTSTIINLIDCRPLNNQPIDLKIFKDLTQTYLQSSNQNCDTEQIKKKPRLDKGNFSSIKFILNDLNINTQHLLNFSHTSFDAEDLELMRTIKNSIEKCLTN